MNFFRMALLFTVVSYAYLCMICAIVLGKLKLLVPEFRTIEMGWPRIRA